MSRIINDGGPAFPQSADGANLAGDLVPQPFPGMTLRDWFAGQALTGLMACAECNPSPTDAAVSAYAYADAMLARRTVTAEQDGEAPAGVTP